MDDGDGAVAVAMLDPLPGRYLTEGPGIGGRIKERPEDFLVDEQPLYEPCGEGEHLYLGIEKTRVSHSELMSRLTRRFGLDERAVGFAGMKDKHGVTRQTVSLHMAADPPSLDLEHDRIRVLWSMRHRNKLRRGHLAGNRFSIRIRGVDPARAPRVARQLALLARTGLPCYFGPQRFGYRANNHRIGHAILRGAWREAIDELLGTTGSPFPEYQRERRELYGAGRHPEAIDQWTPADRSERMVLRALARGRSPREACLAPGRTTVWFWISAFQSALFNRLLDERLDAGTLGELEAGDVAWNHGSRRHFIVDDAVLAEPETRERLDGLEISPSGPLWGARMPRALGYVAAREAAALASVGLDEPTLAAGRHAPPGGRRPYRAALRHPEVDAGADEHGPYIRVAFDLPRGVYATVALREIMRNDASGEDEESGDD